MKSLIREDYCYNAEGSEIAKDAFGLLDKFVQENSDCNMLHLDAIIRDQLSFVMTFQKADYMLRKNATS